MNRDPIYRTRRVVAPLLAGALGTTLFLAGGCARPGTAGGHASAAASAEATRGLPACASNAPSAPELAPEPLGTTINLAPNSPTSFDALLGVDGPDAQTAGLTDVEGQINDYVKK